jgi:hypothetical protein
LGLPQAHEIIRGHGGEIRVTSRRGRTTFEIYLPRKGAVPSVTAAEKRPSASFPSSFAARRTKKCDRDSGRRDLHPTF